MPREKDIVLLPAGTGKTKGAEKNWRKDSHD